MILVIAANVILSALVFIGLIGLIATAIRPSRAVRLSPRRALPAAVRSPRGRAGDAQPVTA